ncbi:MAG: nuclear transport factor 2 family protein [Terricaulis sp.]
MLLGAGATAACAATPASADARETLLAFLRAFENCDLPAMEAAFAPDATHFDRALPQAGGNDLSAFKRGQGMPPGMRHIAEALPRTSPGPPYHHVVAEDLLVQGSDEVAVCSFHLTSADSLGRRTVVLARRAGHWKIIHLHASNVGAG